MGLSVPHLLVVLAIVVLVFGTKRLKTVGADLGDAIKGFRRAVKDAETDQAQPSGGLLSTAQTEERESVG
ncbi:twin-arginine translocase TatA/TatE family subunit [Methylomonas sp. UP202]|uniref:twin-arginine translocase TatA/TatE family subunit n=1 Tax=Methylomonas sp. UP202 TaxID=3040943 RepID=UPI002479B56C|nr:twin-arginine translocase TatA/TatE family subunit [Methylomonas sp. UP202]WGS87612.1 twin-arginine translocase TatA/TatE family subunit [Methylomonas sp. UP202]